MLTTRRGRRGKRTPEDVEKVSATLLAYVKKHDGQRIEEIGKGMGVATKGLKLPIQKLIKAVYWHTRRHWHTVPECVLFDPDLLYRPRPGSCVFENAEFNTTMHFDAQGARVTPPPVSAAGDEGPLPRVVVVGDSHAMGWGVQDHETFASILASEFGYRTVNLAVSSYGTPRELLRLRRDFLLQPDDVVVIQYCDNDFAENEQYAVNASIGPYRIEDLQHLFDYRPAQASALPVAGVILRLIWQDLARALASRPSHDHAGPEATRAFLTVLAGFPELRRQRLLVVAINGPGAGTHLEAAELSAARIPLIVTELARDDFLEIDDHMRPRGHHAVATALDAAIRGRGRAR